MKQVELLYGERRDGESDAAVWFCNDYLLLGPKRSVALAVERHNAQAHLAPVSLGTVAAWSAAFDWVERAAQYDRLMSEMKIAAAQAESDDVLNSGIAVTYLRVKRLKEIEADLFAMYMQEEDGRRVNLWLEEHRQMAGEIVINRKFNNQLVQAMLDILEDVAQETGGRRQKIDQTNLDIGITAEQLASASVDMDLFIKERFALPELQEPQQP